MQRTEPPQENEPKTEDTPSIMLFLTEREAEAVNSALARFLFLIENSETEASELFRNSLTATLAKLRDARPCALLLHPTDIEALVHLAELNAAQQQAARTKADSEKRAQAEEQFSNAYDWLHTLHHYPVHRDVKTRIWRLGSEIGRKDT